MPTKIEIVKSAEFDVVGELKADTDPIIHADEAFRGVQVEELIGGVSFTELIYLQCMGMRPTETETARLDAVLVTSVDPLSCGLLRPPGDLGVDIVVAEGQPLGIPLQAGGPWCGLMAVKQKFARRLPGRVGTFP